MVEVQARGEAVTAAHFFGGPWHGAQRQVEGAPMVYELTIMSKLPGLYTEMKALPAPPVARKSRYKCMSRYTPGNDEGYTQVSYVHESLLGKPEHN